MSYRVIRRICALLLALALGLGLAVHGVQTGEMAAKMMAAAIADSPSPGGGDDCGGDGDDMGNAACAPVCLGPMAILPMTPTTDAPPTLRTAVFAHAIGAGRIEPPNPFPPRPPLLA